MSTLDTRRIELGVLGALLPLMLLSACEKPVVVDHGSAATVGKAEIQVGNYEIKYIEVEHSGQTFEYADPVMVIPVTMTNKGEAALTYSPNHKATTASEASTPLLYPDPGPEAELPPKTKAPIKAVVLQKGDLPKQIKTTTVIKPGESVTDLFLFQVPPKEITSVILSLPPTMHGGKMPLLVRMPFTFKEAQGFDHYETGDKIDFGNVVFSVTGTEIAYIKIKDTAQGDGFSSKPLFKISYTVTNKGDDTLNYEPNHNVQGAAGPMLFSGGSQTHTRMRFPATTTADGQVSSKSLGKDESVKDYVLFELPNRSTKSVVLHFPAKIFQSSGLARIEMPYKYKDVPKPKELTKPAAPKKTP